MGDTMENVIDISQKRDKKVKPNVNTMRLTEKRGDVLEFGKDKINIEDSGLSFTRNEDGTIPFVQFRIGNIVWFVSFAKADITSIIIRENSKDMDYDRVDFNEFKDIKESILTDLKRVNIDPRDKRKIASKLNILTQVLELKEKLDEKELQKSDNYIRMRNALKR